MIIQLVIQPIKDMIIGLKNLNSDKERRNETEMPKNGFFTCKT